MRVFSIAKGFHYLWKHAPAELSPIELDRLRAINSSKTMALSKTIKPSRCLICIEPIHALYYTLKYMVVFLLRFNF